MVTSFDLPADYHSRWERLAQYGIDKLHGQICRLALMYALTLRRGAAAESSRVHFVRPRVWRAEGSRTYRSDRVSLFSDDIVRSLLNVVEGTKDFPKPTYPVVPCGSSSVEVWCHSLASRKQYKGKTNFEALSEQFLLPPARGQWTPNSIHTAAVAVFRNKFFHNPTDAPRILAEQLGLKTFKTALYVAQTYSMEPAEGDDGAMGHVDRCDGQLLWRP